MRVDQSFIPVEGVGETTERRLWEAGVHDWDAFRPDPVGETRAERIARFIAQGRDHLAADDVAYFAGQFPTSEYWRLYETFRDRAVCFDIETTGLDQDRDRVTTVSIHRPGTGETTTLVRGDDLTADALAAALGGDDLLVTFNGKRFDVPFLETSFDVDLSGPHLDLMYPCRALDLTGGLDAVEAHFGVERDRPDVSGRDAVRLWHEHERGVDGSLETLIEYNREDTVNLATVADRVTDRLHRRTLPEAVLETVGPSAVAPEDGVTADD